MSTTPTPPADPSTIVVPGRKIKGYGWHRDSPDDRDYAYEEHHAVLGAAKLANKISLASSMPGIYNQLQLGGCVGNGTARVMEYTESKQGKGMVTPSRLFIYGNARKLEGTYATDSGAQVRDGIKGVVKYGAPPESLWPYSDADPGPFNAPIPDSVYTAAAQEKALLYTKINPRQGANPIRTAIYNGTPIVFGFSVPSYFEDASVWNPATTPLPLPNAKSSFIGGHCVVITGYDFSRTEFKNMDVFEIDNSWGTDWGIGGRFYMDARWFWGKQPLADSLWVIETVS